MAVNEELYSGATVSMHFPSMGYSESGREGWGVEGGRWGFI